MVTARNVHKTQIKYKSPPQDTDSATCELAPRKGAKSARVHCGNFIFGRGTSVSGSARELKKANTQRIKPSILKTETTVPHSLLPFHFVKPEKKVHL